MQRKDVKCFKKNPKGDPAEYDRQLADQEKGLNDLTVKEYMEGRNRYSEIGREGTGLHRKQRAKNTPRHSRHSLKSSLPTTAYLVMKRPRRLRR